MELTGLLLGTVLVLLGVFLISNSQAPSKEPPGPRPLPVLGNLLQLDLRRPHHTFTQLSKKYGPVFRFFLGQKKVVVLVGYKAVKEALVNYAEEFGEREPLQTLKDAKHGVVWSNGDVWREMRRFTMSNLRDFGMGKRACEEKIIEESGHLIQKFKSFKGEPFDTDQVVHAAVSNVVSSLVYGHRFEYDDPEFTAMVHSATRTLQLLGSRSVQLAEIFPRLGKWLSKTAEEVNDLCIANRTANQKIISELRETLDLHSSRGLIDAFLIRQQQLQESGVRDSQFHEVNLQVTVANLFGAGTDTTASALRWGLLFISKYPHFQDQAREEISRVIGSRQVQVEDRKDLPFTDAVIHETQRLGNIVPMSLAHRTSRDVNFRGYFIKKGTTVFTSLASVLYDEREWEKPHSFHPAHFLDKDGRFVKRDAFMPFSAGKRACLGEGLARMELFLFFVSLLQHFRFTAPPGVTEEELDLTPRPGATQGPSPHQLCAVPLL